MKNVVKKLVFRVALSGALLCSVIGLNAAIIKSEVYVNSSTGKGVVLLGLQHDISIASNGFGDDLNKESTRANNELVAALQDMLKMYGERSDKPVILVETTDHKDPLNKDLLTSDLTIAALEKEKHVGEFITPCEMRPNGFFRFDVLIDYPDDLEAVQQRWNEQCLQFLREIKNSFVVADNKCRELAKKYAQSSLNTPVQEIYKNFVQAKKCAELVLDAKYSGSPFSLIQTWQRDGSCGFADLAMMDVVFEKLKSAGRVCLLAGMKHTDFVANKLELCGFVKVDGFSTMSEALEDAIAKKYSQKIRYVNPKGLDFDRYGKALQYLIGKVEISSVCQKIEPDEIRVNSVRDLVCLSGKGCQKPGGKMRKLVRKKK